MPAQSPEDYATAPIFRPETGTHIASVRHINVDREERFLVSGSDDKMLRVWDLASGRMLRTVRVPLGEGNLGKVDGWRSRLMRAQLQRGLNWQGIREPSHIHLRLCHLGSAPLNRGISEHHQPPRLCPEWPASGGGIRGCQRPMGLRDKDVP
jgi:hypothetical protein